MEQTNNQPQVLVLKLKILKLMFFFLGFWIVLNLFLNFEQKESQVLIKLFS